MIITLKGADFSQSNIGTLSSWRISRSLGSGATYEGVTSVDKGAAFSATVTLAEGYEVSAAGVTITMGGIVLSGAHSISDNVITITIAEVTGNVLIKVPTVNTAGGDEPEEPDTPDEPVLTYYDITEQGTRVGNIKDSQVIWNTGGYYITEVLLQENAISVEYQAFPTGAKFGSAFTDASYNVIKMLDKTGITVGDRVTELVPEGATKFLHMWDNPNDSIVTGVPEFTYIRVNIDPSIVINPYMKKYQDINNNNMLNTATGEITTTNPKADGGSQCITIYEIPEGATKVNYLTFKTGAAYGSGFFDENGTFISGYPATVNERHTLDIPSNAKTFYFMYPNPIMVASSGITIFDYVEFIK
jgi:hypothetical protein